MGSRAILRLNIGFFYGTISWALLSIDWSLHELLSALRMVAGGSLRGLRD